MVKCPECGKELKENFKRCPNCGHAVSKDTGERDFLIAKILAVAAILVVAASIGIFLSQNDGFDTLSFSPDENATSSGDTEYWAEKDSYQFHFKDCILAKDIKKADRIIYTSREDAVADGKKPCSICDP